MMIRPKQMFLFATVLGLAGLAVVATHRSTVAPMPKSAEAKRLDAAERQIAQLQSEMLRDRAMSQLVHAVPEVPRNAPGEAASAQPMVAGSQSAEVPPPAPRPREVSTQEIRDSLSGRFFAEGYDSKWSVITRDKVQGRLAGALPPGSRLLSLDCKTSMCRAEVSEPDLDSHQRFMRSVLSPTVPWEGSAMVTLADEPGSDRVTSVAFLAREGQSLAAEDDTQAAP